MALLHSFEKSGSFLFKYRGQVPLVFFLLGLPFIYFGNYSCYWNLTAEKQCLFSSIILTVAVLVSLLGFIIRAYTIGTTPRGTSGRNTDKQVAEVLNTKGIYSIVRHPLYVGNYLMWAGLLIFTMNIYLFLIISLLYWLYYERIMFTEERYLESRFGEQFFSWSEKVPAFVPKFSLFQKGDIPFSMKAVLRREYAGFFAMVFSYTAVDYLLYIAYYCRFMNCTQPFNWCRPSLIVLAAALIIMLVLRTLKHNTTLLNPETDRD